MKRFIHFSAIAVFLAGLSFSASGLDIPLKYEPIRDGIPYANGRVIGTFSPTHPEGSWKLPSTESPLQYALLKLADGVHLLALEQIKSRGNANLRLYIDRDGDGDLTDEKPLEGRAGNFGLIEMSVLSGKVRQPHRIALTLRKGSNGFFFQCSDSGVYRGVVSLDGVSFSITLYDRDGDGRFDDIAKPPVINQGSRQLPEGARALISENGYGDYSEVQPLCDFLYIRSRLYRLKVDTARDILTLTPVAKGLSFVKLPMPVERLSLYDQKHARYLTAYHPLGDTIPVPPGSYHLFSYQAIRKDKKGEFWRLSAQGTMLTPVLEAEANKTASLVFGEPLAPQLVCNAFSHFFFSQLSMNLNVIEGAGRERIQSLEAFPSNPSVSYPYTAQISGRRPDMPKFTILKADGELVARGFFRYG